jgi:hypothetical protein
MTMFDELAFERSLNIARSIQAETGFPPALDDFRLNVHKFAYWEPFEENEPLDELIALQNAGDPVVRSVVGAGLHFLVVANAMVEDYEIVANAFSRYINSVDVADITELRILRWELQAAAVAGDRTACWQSAAASRISVRPRSTSDWRRLPPSFLSIPGANGHSGRAGSTQTFGLPGGTRWRQTC